MVSREFLQVPVDVRSALHKQLHHVELPLVGSGSERASTVRRCVHVGAAIQEEPDRFHVPLMSGSNQRVPAAGHRVDIGALIEKESHDVDTPLMRRCYEWCALVGSRGISGSRYLGSRTGWTQLQSAER